MNAQSLRCVSVGQPGPSVQAANRPNGRLRTLSVTRSIPERKDEVTPSMRIGTHMAAALIAASMTFGQPAHAGGAMVGNIETVSGDVTQYAKPLKAPPKAVDKGRVWVVLAGGALALFGGTYAIENNEDFFPAISRANKAMREYAPPPEEYEDPPTYANMDAKVEPAEFVDNEAINAAAEAARVEREALGESERLEASFSAGLAEASAKFETELRADDASPAAESSTAETGQPSKHSGEETSGKLLETSEVTPEEVTPEEDTPVSSDKEASGNLLETSEESSEKSSEETSVVPEKKEASTSGFAVVADENPAAEPVTTWGAAGAAAGARASLDALQEELKARKAAEQQK